MTTPSRFAAWVTEYMTWKRFRVLLLLVLLIFFYSADQAVFYRISFAFRDYLWYLSTVLLTVAFLCVTWPVVWYKMFVSGEITPEMRKVPQYKFMIMGACDTLYNVLSTFPIAHIGANLANIFSQIVLPFNMVAAYFFLRTRYKREHYMGSAMIIYGVVIAVVFKSSFNEASSSSSVGDLLWWLSLLVISQIPLALGNVYKEVGLKNYDLDVWYANAWIATWQLLFGILSFWTVSLKVFVGNYGVPLDRVIDYLGDATRCFFGETVVDSIDGTTHEYCSDTPVYIFLVYMFLNVVTNQLMLYVFKFGSSVLSVIAAAIKLPIVNLFVMSPVIAGHATESFGLNDAFGLVALLLGLYTYYSVEETTSERPNTSGSGASDAAAPLATGGKYMEHDAREVLLTNVTSGHD